MYMKKCCLFRKDNIVGTLADDSKRYERCRIVQSIHYNIYTIYTKRGQREEFAAAGFLLDLSTFLLDMSTFLIPLGHVHLLDSSWTCPPVRFLLDLSISQIPLEPVQLLDSS